MAYPKGLVSRIKGAMRAGLTPKLLSRWTGIPCYTLKEWRADDRQASVAPDENVLEDLRLALLKEN